MADPTIFDALRDDHDKQRRLVERIRDTSGASEERADLWQRLKDELEAHARAEDSVFYAPLLAEKGSRDLARHSVHEHVELDELVERVEELDFDNPHWLRRFDELGEKIEHHLAEEEKEMFPLAGRVLSDTEKKKMAQRMQGMKDQLLYQELRNAS